MLFLGLNDEDHVSEQLVLDVYNVVLRDPTRHLSVAHARLYVETNIYVYLYG